jgi:archaellum component FlaG (FlaF/FlaG flagellin family)
VIGGAAVPASAATTDGGVAWTVQTADNDNGVGRGNFTYDAQPGAVISDAMVVVNTGTIALPLTVYAADAFTTPSGEIDVLVDGTVSKDSGTWVAVDPASLELAPGQSAEVTFTISVPADARPGDHSAGIVTSLVSEDPSQSLSVDRRLGTRINVRVAGELTPAADVSGVTASYTPSWNPFASGTLTVSYALDNSGNTRLTGTETFTAGGVFGLFGSASPTTQLAEVIPGSVIEVRRELPVLAMGWLSGAVTITPQGVGLGAAAVDPIIVEYSIPAVPWSLLVMLVLVAGLVVLGVVIVRRRRPREAAPAAAEPAPAT